jgi:vacuolar-type H+-ATPase subunit H
MQLFEEIKRIIQEAEKDADAFYNKGNKAAGTRLRKAMMEAKNKAHEIRQEVTDMKNKEA